LAVKVTAYSFKNTKIGNYTTNADGFADFIDEPLIGIFKNVVFYHLVNGISLCRAGFKL